MPHAGLGDPGVLRTVAFNGVYLALIGLVGVGLGAMIRHTGAAIGTLFGLLFVPPFVLGVLGSAGIQVAKFTPMIILLNSVGVVTPTPAACPRGRGSASSLCTPSSRSGWVVGYSSAGTPEPGE